MIACQGCQRHIRAEESSCPFCGAALRQDSAPVRELVSTLGALSMGAMLLVGVACSPKTSAETQAESSSGTTTASETETETGEATTFMTSFTEGEDMPDDPPATSASFYAPPEDPPTVSECDPFAQDCPEGEKCVPYGSTGGNWDANKCVPVMGDGAAGDACVYDGVVQATDDCDEDTHCWDVMDVDGMNVGVCTPFCQGTADDPICDEGTQCVIANEGSITLCISTCDPLLQDCGEGLACYLVDEHFLCLFTTQDIPTGEPCGFLNDCAGGNGCVLAELVPDCDGSACCAPFCDIADPMSCAELELDCLPVFEEPVPPGFEDIGYCTLPPP